MGAVEGGTFRGSSGYRVWGVIATRVDGIPALDHAQRGDAPILSGMEPSARESSSIGRRSVLRACAGLGAAAALGGLQACARGVASRGGPLPGPDWPTVERPVQQKRRFAAVPGALEAPVGVRPRRDWTSSRTIPSRADRMGTVERVTVHHDGMPPVTLRTAGDVRDRIAMIRTSHVGRGWADIGYHFVIDPMGEVWEGRPLVWQGAHVRDHNPRNIGVMVLGNFEVQSPTPDAIASLDDLLVSLMIAHSVRFERLRTHQEYASTACPGRHLQTHMVRTRSSGGGVASAILRT